jgi:hypothetical protein
MASMPDMPINSAATVGVLAVIGLVAFQQHLRTRVETQIHENYRSFKLIDAGIVPETPSLKIAQG